MKQKRTWIICILLCTCAAVALLAGCGRQKTQEEGQHAAPPSSGSDAASGSDVSSGSDAASESVVSSGSDAASGSVVSSGSDAASGSDVSSGPDAASESDSSSGSDNSPASKQTAVLYVGTKANGFTEYPMEYEGELTPELLIQGIADLTGWNLTLAEAVVSGKGGMSVCLSNDSSLFTGPSDPQKDEFHMYSAEHLAETILDSIQKTLQEGFTGGQGDPDGLDIWYFMEGEQPLELPDTGRSWPIGEPYQWAAGQH